MSASWWLALAAVMVLALIVTLVDGWGRSGRRPKPGRRPRTGAPRGRRLRRSRKGPPRD